MPDGSVIVADDGFVGPTPAVFKPESWFEVQIGPIDFYMNKWSGLTIFTALFVGFILWLGFRRAQIVPRGLQNFCESIYDFVDLQIARDVIGERGRQFTPYLTILFMFILVSNVMAVVPVAQFPTTSRIALPMVLAGITFVIYNYVGIKEHGAGPYFKEMLVPAPEAPLGVKVILAPIEFLSTMIVRPFTLAVRLFANMFAGHMLLLIFALGADYLLPKPTFVFGLLSAVTAIILTAFEFVIDVLQAYIFTILTAAYIGGAITSHGAGDEHAVGHAGSESSPIPTSPAVARA
ncbi:F0F1 ATP synthase subunit A [Candidatus Protofrankia californiensis]|uniref:F0F1 ATP synthase subunit A n=1 Tax=Candidatus Protofrankia californiensis TaxID=1839754 RepID=UPI001041B83E|nr:F0F1 ATP synthase subunit A [Candidatus Protofrankia californiensis]